MQRFWMIIGRCKTALLNAVPDLLAIIGAILIAYGISMIYLPACMDRCGSRVHSGGCDLEPWIYRNGGDVA